ncbi:MAG: S1C family serine protease [Bacillota bacterium]
MFDEKDRVKNSLDESGSKGEERPVESADAMEGQPAAQAGTAVEEPQQVEPALELPEIPAPAPAPAPLYSPPAPEPRRSGSGWRLFAAALALVVISTAVGSGTTYYLMSKYQQESRPIGYSLIESPGMKAISQTTAEAAASVVPSIYRRVAPSVVAITVSAGDGFFRSQGSGSGFVVDPRGYILTNYHVVDQAQRIQVKFVDGTTMNAKVVGTHRWRDLAVLKVEPGNRSLVAAPLGDSDQVEVGELAIAIGNPFGQEFTVTAGIVSALNREITEEGNPVSIPGAIQTDAAINPGNSGGPLLNARGEVIGINTAIEGPVRGNVGLGFAVPVNLAKEILPKLIAGEKLQKPFLGVSLRDMNAQAAQLLGTDVREGTIVWGVEPGSAAEKAGLQPPTFDETNLLKSADVIVKANETEIRNTSDLINFIARQKIGDTITLTVVRGKERVTLQATLGAADIEE